MNYKQLFLFVEGDDDERFFERIVKPKFEEKYHTVKLWKYAQVKNTKVDNFLKSIKAMGAEYIFVADINSAPCVTSKKKEIQKKFKNIDIDRIIVVIKEIEGWYLAGLDAKSSKKLKIPYFDATDDITKEKFNNLILEVFDSEIDFMLEIMRWFSIEIAKKKNKSFRYFLGKHNCKD
jgi:hypothetical protein